MTDRTEWRVGNDGAGRRRHFAYRESLIGRGSECAVDLRGRVRLFERRESALALARKLNAESCAKE